jgi:hypothetical protein
LRGRGITVANLTNEENHRTHLRHTPEEYLEYAQRGLGQLTPEQRRENGRKGAATGAGVRALERLGAETRRANGLKGANARWHPI